MPNPHLPAETLDDIVDLLHDETYALRNCCLVSKSWIPRTRKHLFADIRFTDGRMLQSWKESFPDPSTSPARYTKILVVGCAHAVTAADREPGGWITGFSRVVRFGINSLDMLGYWATVTFAPFHGFSPAIKSIRVVFIFCPTSKFLDLIFSFPLLEDLTVMVEAESEGNPPTTAQLSNPPPFTGSLELRHRGGIKPVAHRLLSLPSGIHFRKLTLGWFGEEHLSLIMRLVVECSNTLESLDITCHIPSKSIGHLPPHTGLTPFLGERSTSIDLSKAIKLKEMVFRPNSRNVEWITMALQTITRKHQDFRQVSINVDCSDISSISCVGDNIRKMLGERVYGQWLDLDHFLDQFLGSPPIHPKVVCIVPEGLHDMEDHFGCLLPVLTKRGRIDLVNQSHGLAWF